ncbi:3'(2'),5'-bisphosphate nucleotidase CysQ [Halioglobus japonicus]|nr:3'(2'),5'-bisphosphate nucleotidase CysQ [Halioglobus japonicus]
MNSKVSEQKLQSWVEPLLALCRVAGEAICEHYSHPAAGDYESKDDDSPLTRADLASHHLLLSGLESLDASLPVLSEESTPEEIAQRRDWRSFWLIDPLDGTREFLERTGEFTINIALIDDHKPVLGILYLPLEKVAYVGIPGVLARRYTAAGNGNWVVGELATRALQDAAELTVLASRRHRGPRFTACLAWLEEQWEPAVRRSNMGSALKFSRMAEGHGDVYPRFSPCCEWDTGAGQAVLEAAGGLLLGLDGKPLRYNCGDSLLSPPFYAIADGRHPLWSQLLEVNFA